MSLPLFISIVSLFWLALHRYLKTSTRARSLLPSHALTRRTHSDITLKGVYLHYEYTGLNVVHARLGRWMADGSRRSLRRVVVGVYEVGVVLGILGMVVGLGLMGRIAISLSGQLLATTDTQYNHDSVTNASMGLFKRTLVEDAAVQPVGMAPTTSALDVHLLIPGVTLPWSAMIPLFFALAFSQAFHEAGHAICAALDRIQLSSTGFSLTLLIPAFFVALPTPLPARSAPRIAAAGALHNLLLFVIFSIPLSTLWTQDVSTRGAGIVAVDGDIYDGLADVLTPGDIVASLDDTSLAGTGTEAWEAYFARSQTTADNVPWCVDSEVFATQPTSAKCEGGTILFGALNAEGAIPEGQTRCLDPVPIMASELTRRCPCGPGSVCVRPAPSEPPIMRIQLEDGHVVLWRGPKNEVYEQVEVADRLPRLGGGPLGLGYILTDAASTFAIYVRALTLSLYLFNLLPLPRLDGAQLLDSILDLWTTRRDTRIEVELDDVERGDGTNLPEKKAMHGRRTTWAQGLARGVRGIAIGLLVSCIILGLLTGIKDGLS
ncbi:unnamed protein product [Peniophora sp. CBMAI 1063]|nr:unnamed protein product [Peniophora sp. CBMAI 1063]